MEDDLIYLEIYDLHQEMNELNSELENEQLNQTRKSEIQNRLDEIIRQLNFLLD